MIDGFGRTIDYLRISVTDKCNLRCKYCMPETGIERIPHEELLSLEELYRIIRIMEGIGIRKIRFTGGEPLVRKNIVKLVEDVGRLSGIERIAMTTNGVLFAGEARKLKKAGLTDVNISLDTLDREHFCTITGTDALKKVLDGVDEAYTAGISVKLNCVPCREFNEEDIVRLALLSKDRAVDVRYIELMPLGCGRMFQGIASEEILARLEKAYGKGVEVSSPAGSGPARYVQFNGFKGKIGFISPISHKFCSECNRIRLTAEGRLKLCLHYNAGIELKPLLRGGADDDTIREAVLKAVREKPAAHDFGSRVPNQDSDKRKMVQIGG